MAREGFEEVIALHDRGSGLRAFLGIHDTSAGPAFGGIRRFAYRDEKSALLDCLRLSKAMSHKCALAGIPGGGGKLVLLDRPELDREAAYRSLGHSIEALGGRYYAGPDVGTGWRELGWVAATTAHVTRPGPEGPGDLAGATAAGVFAGAAAALRQLDGAERWSRRRIVVQGLGSVGLCVARRWIDLGAEVLGAEIDPDRARAAGAAGVELLEPGAELDAACDVFCPCAMGGVMHDLSIQRLRARVVCGAANNVLARAGHADALHARGVLYVPDVVVNSGALLRGSSFHLEARPTELDEIELRIGAVVTDVLARAAREQLPPARVALREAERRIEERRNARDASTKGAHVRESERIPDPV